MHKCRISHLLTVSVLIFMAWCGSAYSDASREYQLKAAYLLNFARFIYWPEQAFQDDRQSFNICVYGKSPFGDSLDRLSNKKIKSRDIEIKYISSLSQLKACHMVYISESMKKDYPKIIKKLDDRAVLSVSDIGGFSQNGGMIEFVIVHNKIKFEINVEQSSKSGIKYRSQLLEVAAKLR